MTTVVSCLSVRAAPLWNRGNDTLIHGFPTINTGVWGHLANGWRGADNPLASVDFIATFDAPWVALEAAVIALFFCVWKFKVELGWGGTKERNSICKYTIYRLCTTI